MYFRDFNFIKDGYYYVFSNSSDDSIDSCTKCKIDEVSYSISVQLLDYVDEYYRYEVSHIDQEFSLWFDIKAVFLNKYYILSPVQLAKLKLLNSPLKEMPHERIRVSMKNFKSRNEYLGEYLVLKVKDDLSIDVYDSEGIKLNDLERYITVKLL